MTKHYTITDDFTLAPIVKDSTRQQAADALWDLAQAVGGARGVNMKHVAEQLYSNKRVTALSWSLAGVRTKIG